MENEIAQAILELVTQLRGMGIAMSLGFMALVIVLGFRK